MTHPESRLVRKIQQRIRERGGRPFKIHGESGYQEVGIPDILACYRGRFLGLEVKIGAGKTSKRQENVLQSILDAGGVALVIRSVDDVDRLLDMLDKNSR